MAVSFGRNYLLLNLPRKSVSPQKRLSEKILRLIGEVTRPESDREKRMKGKETEIKASDGGSEAGFTCFSFVIHAVFAKIIHLFLFLVYIYFVFLITNKIVFRNAKRIPPYAPKQTVNWLFGDVAVFTFTCKCQVLSINFQYNRKPWALGMDTTV